MGSCKGTRRAVTPSSYHDYLTMACWHLENLRAPSTCRLRKGSPLGHEALPKWQLQCQCKGHTAIRMAFATKSGLRWSTTATYMKLHQAVVHQLNVVVRHH